MAITARALVARRVESLRNRSGKSFEDHTPDGRWYGILRCRIAAGGTVTAESEEVMSVLHDHHAELGREIMAHDGTIEHFAGTAR